MNSKEGRAVWLRGGEGEGTQMEEVEGIASNISLLWVLCYADNYYGNIIAQRSNRASGEYIEKLSYFLFHTVK